MARKNFGKNYFSNKNHDGKKQARIAYLEL